MMTSPIRKEIAEMAKDQVGFLLAYTPSVKERAKYMREILALNKIVLRGIITDEAKTFLAAMIESGGWSRSYSEAVAELI